ncbi:MAG: molybdopterin-guanine dinucleotide biosynthesis protein B [Methanolinea sp.]|jgi:molybdopterin-guanine dinucleotide biosynthesis protein MobB|nr:molybdopterin-guanine dinucleotide biosynthesis protein B [Methanolinea sp.]
MKVIHVCGESGSGKTTLIRSLIPLLADKGTVAVVKHLGHHSFSLPEGKDTTFYLESGAAISAGIDPGKTVLVADTVSLRTVLDILSFSGTSFAIVEGFKSLPLPKVVMGTLNSAQNVVLDNPRPGDIINSLGKFPDYITYCDLARDLWADGLIALTGSLPADSSLMSPRERREFYDRFFPMIHDMTEEDWGVPNAFRVRVHLYQGLYFGGDDRVIYAAGGPTPGGVQCVVPRVLERIVLMLKTALHGEGEIHATEKN